MLDTWNTLPHLEVVLHDAHLRGEFSSPPPPPKTSSKDKTAPYINWVLLILCSKSRCNRPTTVGGVVRQTNTQTPIRKLQ